jgi:nucleotide-binding universal stress UspA family protein
VLTIAEDAPEPVTGGPIRRRFGPDGDAEAYLAALVEPFVTAGHAVEAVVRYEPVNVWGGLYRYLMDNPAALVATNTRSRKGLRRLVFGSVAATIVRHSPSPVLVMPRREAGSPP